MAEHQHLSSHATLLGCLLGHEVVIVRLAVAISVLRISSKHLYQHMRMLGKAQCISGRTELGILHVPVTGLPGSMHAFDAALPALHRSCF